MTRGARAGSLGAGFVVAALLTGCEPGAITNEPPPVTWPPAPVTLAPEILPPAVADHVDFPDVGPATWILDPAFPPPDASSTTLAVLVWEESCSSGSPATGRIAAPVVEATETTLTITLGVRPLGGGMQTCPRPPGTPAIVDLGMPLGDRALLDGGLDPPAPRPSGP